MISNLNRNTQVIIQGITGKEGMRAVEFMRPLGVQIVAGVRPGKAGETVMGIPVFDTVKDALVQFPEAKVSCVYVPPPFVLAAATEALEAGIKLLHIIAEGVPVQDTAKLLAISHKLSATVIGPASLGLIIPEEFKLGQLMGIENESVIPGHVGIVSRSGGMSSEIANLLTQAKIGQSMVIHVGGDFLIGTTPAQVLEYFETDARTKIVLLVGEVGGGYELEVVELIKAKKFTKPLVVFMAGAFLETLPHNVPLGHAGAIIQGENETRSGKIKMLESVGVTVVDQPDQIVSELQDTSNKLKTGEDL